MPKKPNKSWGGRNTRGNEDKVYFGEYLFQFCSPSRMIWKRSYPRECVNIRLASSIRMSIISPVFIRFKFFYVSDHWRHPEKQDGRRHHTESTAA